MLFLRVYAIEERALCATIRLSHWHVSVLSHVQCVWVQPKSCRVELEVTLGASEPTLAEYILDKYEVSKGSAAAFRSVLQKEAGIDGIHVDRLHSLISTLKVLFSHSDVTTAMAAVCFGMTQPHHCQAGRFIIGI